MKKITFVFTDENKYFLFKNWWLEGGGRSIYRDFETFQGQEGNIDYEELPDMDDIVIFSEKIEKGDLDSIKLELEEKILNFLKSEDTEEATEELISKLLQKHLIEKVLENDK